MEGGSHKLCPARQYISSETIGHFFLWRLDDVTHEHDDVNQCNRIPNGIRSIDITSIDVI